MLRLTPFWSHREFYGFLLTALLVDEPNTLEAAAAIYLLILVTRYVYYFIYSKMDYILNLFTLFNFAFLAALMVLVYYDQSMAYLCYGMTAHVILLLVISWIFARRSQSYALYQTFAHLNQQAELINILNSSQVKHERISLLNHRQLNQFVVKILFILAAFTVVVFPLATSNPILYICLIFGVLPFIKMHLELRFLKSVYSVINDLEKASVKSNVNDNNSTIKGELEHK